MDELDDLLDGLLPALEDCLDGSFQGVSRPAVHAELEREPTRRLAKEHPLHAAVDDDAASHR